MNSSWRSLYITPSTTESSLKEEEDKKLQFKKVQNVNMISFLTIFNPCPSPSIGLMFSLSRGFHRDASPSPVEAVCDNLFAQVEIR